MAPSGIHSHESSEFEVGCEKLPLTVTVCIFPLKHQAELTSSTKHHKYVFYK